ncbi:hypothetical protein [Streptomyces pactum]|uniref:hypothetical protein n=1 Tax=Streptomyces pactum TaxID=68249 RepID=UPI0027DB3203|nr:hypothetical protein [Streptomyces pactum]
MVEFWYATSRFPVALFTSALVVVLVFWLLVLVGAADSGSFDGDVDTDALSLGGVPVSVSASLLVVLSWVLALTGALALARTGMPAALLDVLGLAVPPASLLGAWWLTRALVRPLAKLFPEDPRRPGTTSSG